MKTVKEVFELFERQVEEELENLSNNLNLFESYCSVSDIEEGDYNFDNFKGLEEVKVNKKGDI